MGTQPGRITSSIVNENIQKSLRRMDVNSLDLFNSTGGIITIRITWMLSNIYKKYLEKRDLSSI